MGSFDREKRATSGMARGKPTSTEARWARIAPWCLPSPMTSIFIRPLSTWARKLVCGLIRFTRTMWSASYACLSTCTGNPQGIWPISTVSMDERIGTSMLSGVIP